MHPLLIRTDMADMYIYIYVQCMPTLLFGIREAAGGALWVDHLMVWPSGGVNPKNMRA